MTESGEGALKVKLKPCRRPPGRGRVRCVKYEYFMMREAVLTSGRLIIHISIQAAAAGGSSGQHGGQPLPGPAWQGGLFLETEGGWWDGGGKVLAWVGGGGTCPPARLRSL